MSGVETVSVARPVQSQARRNKLADRLVAARKSLGWTRRQLAREGAWCGETNIRAMEEGSRSIPEPFLHWIERLARYHRDNPPPANGGRVEGV